MSFTRFLSASLLALFITSCSSPSGPVGPLVRNAAPISSQNTTANLTTKSAFPIALKAIESSLSAPVLFEIDVWHNATEDTFTYGFMSAQNDGSMAFAKAVVQRQSGAVQVEKIVKGKVPAPVDVQHWALTEKQVLEIARKNGLQDTTFLATLWEDTWHISGLKQHLYFQMDSQSGQIKLRCTGPYNNYCTDGSNNPVTPGPNHRTDNIR